MMYNARKLSQSLSFSLERELDAGGWRRRGARDRRRVDWRECRRSSRSRRSGLLRLTASLGRALSRLVRPLCLLCRLELGLLARLLRVEFGELRTASPGAPGVSDGPARLSHMCPARVRRISRGKRTDLTAISRVVSEDCNLYALPHFRCVRVRCRARSDTHRRLALGTFLLVRDLLLGH